MQPARIDAMIATVKACLAKKEKRARRQKIRADTFASFGTAANRKLVEHVDSFLKFKKRTKYKWHQLKTTVAV